MQQRAVPCRSYQRSTALVVSPGTSPIQSRGPRRIRSPSTSRSPSPGQHGAVPAPLPRRFCPRLRRGGNSPAACSPATVAYLEASGFGSRAAGLRIPYAQGEKEALIHIAPASKGHKGDAVWIMDGQRGDMLVVGRANCTWGEVETKSASTWQRTMMCSDNATWGDAHVGYLDSTVASAATPGVTLLYFINSPDNDVEPTVAFVMQDGVLCVQLLCDVPAGGLAPTHAHRTRTPHSHTALAHRTLSCTYVTQRPHYPPRTCPSFVQGLAWRRRRITATATTGWPAGRTGPSKTSCAAATIGHPPSGRLWCAISAGRHGTWPASTRHCAPRLSTSIGTVRAVG